MVNGRTSRGKDNPRPLSVHGSLGSTEVCTTQDPSTSTNTTGFVQESRTCKEESFLLISNGLHKKEEFLIIGDKKRTRSEPFPHPLHRQSLN